MQRENVWEKIDKIIGCLWNQIKSCNTHEIGFPERERRENGAQIIFEGKMGKNFLELVWDINQQVQ